MKSLPLAPAGAASVPAALPAGLAAHWQGRARYTVLQEGFGRGEAFLALRSAWRTQAAPGARLTVIAIEPQPLAPPDVAPELRAAWPPRTPDLHTLVFDGGAVTLHLAFGPLALWLPELVAEVDAFALATPTPHAQRLAAPGALGLPVPLHHAPRPPGRQAAAACGRVAVVGAGLAGAAVAQALAQRGVQVSVLEQAPASAAGASGNPAGLWHGVVHAHDGAHAQLLRAGALAAARHYAPLVQTGRVPGAADGLARLTDEATAALTARHALPPDWVQPLTAAEAGQRLATPVARGAWWFASGGWISPPALVHHWLATPGVTLHTQAAITHLAPDGNGWRLHAADGRTWTADAVVLAGAHEGLALLAGWCDSPLAPTGRQRGQVTWVDGAGLPQPRHPVASGAYALALPDGRWLCGATSQRGDDDPSVRAADHAQNLARAAALFGLPPPVGLSAHGRVGWRLVTDDRLPLLGPVPLPAAQRQGARRQEQPRQVPRVPGLYVCTALGSRGLTLAPLLGETLAAWMVGEPLPLASSLVDAVDAARFVARAARQSGRHRQAEPQPR